MKLTVSKSKNSASFYVQKSIRKENGSVTTITIEKLGNIEQVRSKAGGKDPYVWAQEYVNELNRREYEEQKSVLVSYSPSKLLKKGEQKSFNCGYLFLQKIYHELKLDKLCKEISERHAFEYDLNSILSRLIYTRILYPSSKLSSHKQACKFIEQPNFKLHDIYRALSVLAEENDFIQSELYKSKQKLISRRNDVLYYDCTNYYFELEQETELCKYGKSKQHQPLPIVGMGLFMDYDGIPLAFDIFLGNQNEQPTLKPLEQKIIKDYGLRNVIVCTDAGLSSEKNRKFNNFSLFGEQIRSFITTQSIKMLPNELKKFALDTTGWHMLGDTGTYDISKINSEEYLNKIFYKERIMVEDLTKTEIKNNVKPLEQRLIVSFSFKYQNYQHKTRERQIERAKQLIADGSYKRKAKSQNDPNRFIKCIKTTDAGEICEKEISYIDTDVISNEEMYDGFYAVCTNLEDADIDDIIKINKKRWQIEECFRIMKTEFKARPVYLQRTERIKAHFITCYIALLVYRLLENKIDEMYTCEELIETLRDMNMFRPGEKQGYIPSYTRTDITDTLHQAFGFRTDYEIISDVNMKKIIRQSKK